jgi:glycerol kinase
MQDKIILALDQGSSSSRVLAVAAQSGAVLTRESAPLAFTTDGVKYEYDAQELLTSQLTTLERAFKAVEGKGQVVSLAVAAQRSTLVMWDKNTGKALCPVLSWLDGRAAKEAQANPLAQPQIHAATGLYKTPYYSAAKIKYCLQNFDAVKTALKENRLCAGPVASYIIWHLTAGKVFAADYTNAQRTLLFNIKTLKWDEEILKSFDIPAHILPEVKPVAADYGSYKGAPIRVSCGDQQAASAASGLLDKGDCAINYGTGAFVLLDIGQTCANVPGILTSLSWNCVLGAAPNYALEGPINAAGSLFTWLNALGLSFDIKALDGVLAASRAPVSVFPALGGLGAPYWNFDLTPVFAGLKPQSKKEDIIAGAARGLCHLAADIAFYIKKAGYGIARVQASGGLCASSGLLKLQSDILQMPITRSRETEVTALGAAYIAAKQAGINPAQWEAFKNNETFTPSLSPQNAQKARQNWRAFFDWASKFPA